MTDPTEMLTAEERHLAERIRAAGSRRPWDLWRYAFTICDVSGATSPLERFRFAAQRLADICEIARWGYK